jgi:hypothetical protein
LIVCSAGFLFTLYFVILYFMSRSRKSSGSGFKDLIIIFLLIVCAVGGLYIFDKPKFDLYFGRFYKSRTPIILKSEPKSVSTENVLPVSKKVAPTNPIIKEDLSGANDAGMEVGGY